MKMAENNRTMNILMLHNHYQQPGGEDQSFFSEREVLNRKDHFVKTYTLHNDAISRMNPLNVARKTIWNSQSYGEVISLLDKNRYDVAHFQNTFPLLSPSTYYAASARNVPVVQSLRNYRLACINGLFFRDGSVCENCLGSPLMLSGVKHQCYRDQMAASCVATLMLQIHKMMKTYQEQVNLYVALSDFSKKKFVEIGLPEEKIVVKPNFVKFDPGMGEGNGGFGLFVGRLSPEKGIKTLLSALEKTNFNIPFKIVGRGSLEELVLRKANSTSNLEWLGHRKIEEVYEIMGKAKVLIFPSEWYETFGRVAIESFSKGTPVIVSKIGAIQELVEDGRTGKAFVAGDSDDLAEKLEWFSDHPIEVRKMRDEARAEYETKYTAEKNYEMLLSIYERAIELSKRR